MIDFGGIKINGKTERREGGGERREVCMGAEA